MADLTALDPRLDARKRTCRAVVECSKGGRSKYTYDPQAQAFELKRVLPDGMCFPLDFGFIPSTKGQDGDPLDILILNDEPAALGALLTVRLIAIIEAEQTEAGKTVRNDRLLAIAETSHLFAHVQSADGLGQPFMRNLTQFWVNYGALRNATFKVLTVKDGTAAIRAIRAAHDGDRRVTA
jgi:inorganic pyrophosphatase